MNSVIAVVVPNSAVLGDSGRMYVAPDVVPIYRAALSCATIITPNWYEVEYVYTFPLSPLTASVR